MNVKQIAAAGAVVLALCGWGRAQSGRPRQFEPPPTAGPSRPVVSRLAGVYGPDERDRNRKTAPFSIVLDLVPSPLAPLEAPSLNELRSSATLAGDDPDGTRQMPQDVVRFRDLGQGVALVIAVDIDTDMAGSRIQSVRQGLRQILARRRPVDRVALVAIGVEAFVLADFRSDAYLDAALARLQTEKYAFPRLFRGLDKALDLFETVEAGFPARRRLFVVGTGRNEGSAAGGAGGFRDEDVLAKARRLNVVIDAIGIPAPVHQLDPEQVKLLEALRLKGLPTSNAAMVEANLENLEKLARATGGIYLRQSPRDSAIGQRLNAGMEWILASPVLQFDAARTVPFDGRDHRVRVELASQPGLALESRIHTWRRRAFPWRLVIFGALLAAAFVLLLAPGKKNRKRQPAPHPPRPHDEDRSPLPPAPPDPRHQVKLPDVDPYRQDKPGPQPGRRQTVYIDSFRQPEPGSPCCQLIARGGPLTGSRYLVDRPEFTLGRESSLNSIALSADPSISARHATLRWNTGVLSITDDGSSNGTAVNQKRLEPSRPHPLRSGDRIYIGQTVLEVLPL